MIQLSFMTQPAPGAPVPIPKAKQDRYINDKQLSYLDGPPFRPGQYIRGVKDTAGADELRRLFGDNYALLSRECHYVQGEWTVFGRPAGEFKILNDEACITLTMKLRLMRIACKIIRKESVGDQDIYYHWRCARVW